MNKQLSLVNSILTNLIYVEAKFKKKSEHDTAIKRILEMIFITVKEIFIKMIFSLNNFALN